MAGIEPLLVRYEDMVADRQGGLASERIIEDTTAHRAHMTAPTVAQSVGRWRTELTPSTASRLTRMLAEPLMRFRYPAVEGTVKAEKFVAIAESHFQGAPDDDEPPEAAAMVMPAPRPLVNTSAVSTTRINKPRVERPSNVMPFAGALATVPQLPAIEAARDRLTSPRPTPISVV